MPIQVSKLTDLPVIIFEYYSNAKAPDDVETTLKEVVAFKKERGGKVYRVIDFSKIQVGFSDMMVGMGTEVGREGGSNDPDVITVFVATGDLLEFGAQALREQEQYGKPSVYMVGTREEAVAFIQKDVKS
jgi:hypothetical protein